MESERVEAVRKSKERWNEIHASIIIFLYFSGMVCLIAAAFEGPTTGSRGWLLLCASIGSFALSTGIFVATAFDSIESKLNLLVDK